MLVIQDLIPMLQACQKVTFMATNNICGKKGHLRLFILHREKKSQAGNVTVDC